MFAVASLGVVVATPRCRTGVMSFMGIGGLGLGFVLPNLTIFAQQTAGREHLGIATALLQSLRMIGGMIGTAMTGSLVTHMYASGVRDALDRSGGDWFRDLGDPQILDRSRCAAHPFEYSRVQDTMESRCLNCPANLWSRRFTLVSR